MHAEGLTRLEELDLSRTKITGAAIPIIGSLPRLRSLALDHLPVHDEDVVSLTQNRGLETLTLEHTAITDGAIATLATMRTLRQLSVKETQMTDLGCNQLTPLHLTAINIGGTHVTVACLVSLGQISSLTELSGDDLNLRVADLSLAPSSRLTTLSLVGSRLDERAVVVLLRLRFLRRLHVNAKDISVQASRRLAAARILVE